MLARQAHSLNIQDTYETATLKQGAASSTRPFSLVHTPSPNVPACSSKAFLLGILDTSANEALANQVLSNACLTTAEKSPIFASIAIISLAAKILDFGWTYQQPWCL